MTVREHRWVRRYVIVVVATTAFAACTDDADDGAAGAVTMAVSESTVTDPEVTVEPNPSCVSSCWR